MLQLLLELGLRLFGLCGDYWRHYYDAITHIGDDRLQGTILDPPHF